MTCTWNLKRIDHSIRNTMSCTKLYIPNIALQYQHLLLVRLLIAGHRMSSSFSQLISSQSYKVGPRFVFVVLWDAPTFDVSTVYVSIIFTMEFTQLLLFTNRYLQFPHGTGFIFQWPTSYVNVGGPGEGG